MSPRLCIALLIVRIFGDISALVELPQVDKNNILETDRSIRDTTNKLFTILRLKVKERPILKQYSLIHNYLVSTSLQDYTNLIEVAKLTRVDKIKLNNQTKHFMDILNEVLNEDIKHDTEIEDVIEHIDGFLKNLDEYTDTYKYRKNNVEYIITEILNYLKNYDSISKEHSQNFYDDNRWSINSENTTLLEENEIWQPSGRRIYNGKKTTIKEFPFMASIQIFNHFQCAGSIIKSDLIITAASCLQLAWNNRFFRENPAFLSARVGSTFHNGGGENIPILEVYFHPDYDPHSLRNNLAILRLLRVLNLSTKSSRLKKIAIDRHANALPSNTNGIAIVGWGARRKNNIIQDPYLSFAVLDFYDLRECQEIYSKQYVTRKHFCAGFLSVGGGACNRDIGGPGITHGHLAGIISFGSPVCGTPDAPTVFTKLGYYSDWIDGIIDKRNVWNARMTTLQTPKFFTVPTKYYNAKTTFKVKPPVFSKKPKSDSDNNILRQVKGTKTSKVDIVKRIPFTYSPLTTLDPPDLPSTQMSNIQQDQMSDIQPDQILRDIESDSDDDDKLVKELFSSIVESKEANNLLKEATKVTTESNTPKHQVTNTLEDEETDSPEDQEVNTPEKQEVNTPEDQETDSPESNLIKQMPSFYSYVTTLEPPEITSVLMGIMKADDTTDKIQEAVLSNTHDISNTSNKLTVEDKDKELNSQLEQDIIQILDEINLEDYLIKESKRSKNQLPIKNGDKDIKDIFTLLYLSDSEQNNMTILSGENEGSHEGGMEIITDAFKNFSMNNNKTENIFDSDKILYEIVTDVLKEELHNKFNKNSSKINDENSHTIQSSDDEPQNIASENNISKNINVIKRVDIKTTTKTRTTRQNEKTPKKNSRRGTKRTF